MSDISRFLLSLSLLQYYFTDDSDLWLFKPIMCLVSTPPSSNTVMQVHRIQWLVYILDKPQSSLILAIKFPSVFLPTGASSYQISSDSLTCPDFLGRCQKSFLSGWSLLKYRVNALTGKLGCPEM
jgi:hypothetical protein